MRLDIATLLFTMTVCMVTMAVALPAAMGQVNEPARRAQAGVVLQGTGWALLLISGLVDGDSASDRVLSTLARAGIASGLALNATAFDLWCGRAPRSRVPVLIAVILPLGYGLGFSSYAFRVGWANGLLTLQMALVVAAVWRKPAVPVGKWRWLLVVSLVAQRVVTLWRGILGAFFTESYPTFLAPHPANSASHPVAVLMIDIDHFKQVNDGHGHDAGDRALVFMARALQAAVRPGDLVGRFGGEEFCVLMTHADHAAARAFDVRMREYLAAAAERELGFALAYSAGIAMRNSSDDTLAAMLKRADETLYSAKAQGRSRTLDAKGPRLQAA